MKHLEGIGVVSDDLELFLSNIKNAPLLEQLTLGSALLDLVHLEKLHSSLPKLEILSLDGLWHDENENDTQDVGITDTADCVRSITVAWSKTVSNDKLIKWIAYIGKKYPNLEVLKLDYLTIFGHVFPSPSEAFESQMVNTLSRLGNIKIYEVKVYPYLTREIVKALDDGGSRLKTISMHLSNDDQVKQEFENVMASPSRKSIENLHIYFPTLYLLNEE